MAEVLLVTIMRQRITIPEGIPPAKRRGFARPGDLIAAELVTLDNPAYTFDGTRWGFNSIRSGQCFVYLFITNCPDGTLPKVQRLIGRQALLIAPEEGIQESDNVPRRFQDWHVNVDMLSNPIKQQLQTVGYVQATYNQVINFISRKVITNNNDPDTDTTGTNITLAEIEA